MNEEMDLARVLLIRQSVGKAVRAYAVQHKLPEDMREVIATDLEILLRKLLPLSERNVVRDFAKTVIDKAIVLRNEMTTEGVLYRCFMLDSGQSFNPDFADVRGEDVDRGKISLCVFFGLRRLSVGDDHKKRFVVVTKADVMLT